MAKKTWTTTVHDDGETYYIPSHGNPKGPPRYVGGDACTLCGITRGRDEFVYFRGRPYCRENGCDRDIPGLQKRHDTRSVSRVRES